MVWFFDFFCKGYWVIVYNCDCPRNHCLDQAGIKKKKKMKYLCLCILSAVIKCIHESKHLVHYFCNENISYNISVCLLLLIFLLVSLCAFIGICPPRLSPTQRVKKWQMRTHYSVSFKNDLVIMSTLLTSVSGNKWANYQHYLKILSMKCTSLIFHSHANFVCIHGMF